MTCCVFLIIWKSVFSLHFSVDHCCECAVSELPSARFRTVLHRGILHLPWRFIIGLIMFTTWLLLIRLLRLLIILLRVKISRNVGRCKRVFFTHCGAMARNCYNSIPIVIQCKIVYWKWPGRKNIEPNRFCKNFGIVNKRIVCFVNCTISIPHLNWFNCKRFNWATFRRPNYCQYS